MNVSGEYRLSVDRPTAWRALNDPEVLQRCIPGCEELEQLDSDSYRASVRMSIGPMKATFRTDLSIVDADPPASYRLRGEGRSGAVGFGRGEADVTLSEASDGTLLRYEARFQVGGRLAQLGSRLVVGATRKVADDFFARLSRDIDAGAVPGGGGIAASKGGRSGLWLAIGVACALLLLAWLWLG